MSIEGRGVQSIDVGGRILAVLVGSGTPLTLRDLSALASMAPGQAHAYLTSFRKMGLVEQDPNTSRYQLGPFALHLGLARMRSFSPLKLANAAAIELCAQTGHRVMVGVWGSHGATAVQVEDGADDLHLDLRPGKVHSLLKTATGKVFAAFLPRSVVEPRLLSEIEAWSRRQFVGEAPTIEECVRDAAEVRSRGYAITNGDPTPGISTLSAPVLDRTGQIQFALTLVGASRSLDVSVRSSQVRRMLEFTSGLCSQLGYERKLSEGTPTDAVATARAEPAPSGKDKPAPHDKSPAERTPMTRLRRQPASVANAEGRPAAARAAK